MGTMYPVPPFLLLLTNSWGRKPTLAHAEVCESPWGNKEVVLELWELSIPHLPSLQEWG